MHARSRACTRAPCAGVASKTPLATGPGRAQVARESALPGRAASFDFSTVRLLPPESAHGERTWLDGGSRPPWTGVIQRSSDPAPPPGRRIWQAEEDEREVAGPAVDDIVGDFGQGVASVEAGTASSGGVPPQREEDEERKKGVVQTWRGDAQGTPAPRRQPLSALGPGRPLDSGVRADMERSFGDGVDFSRVRLHDDRRGATAAAALGAQAFTWGHRVAFAAGRYRPATHPGRHLLAHELTHVVQQQRGLTGPILGAGIGSPGDPWEREAEATAQRVAAGAPAPPVATGARSRAAPVGTAALQLYSGSAAAAYARTWANSTNSDYGRFGNDCTNFVSQALEAGGWSMITCGDYCDHRKRDYVWWFRKGGCRYTLPLDLATLKTINASYTWGGAHNLYQFIKKSGRGTALSQVYQLDVGDILQMGDSSGHIFHTLIVTKNTSDNTYLSYHTSDHLDEPFWGTGGIRERYPDVDYYAWHITDSTKGQANCPKPVRCTPKYLGMGAYLGSDCIVRQGAGPKV